MIKTWNTILLVFVAWLALSGCMVSPHDEQWFNNRTDEIEFSGFVGAPLTIITLEVYRRSLDHSPDPGWGYLTQAASDPEPVWTDPSTNVKWYRWSAKVRLGTDLTIWQSRSGEHGFPGYSARIRSFIGDVSSPGYLTTFREHLDRCLVGDQMYACGGPKPESVQQIFEMCGTTKKEITINALE